MRKAKWLKSSKSSTNPEELFGIFRCEAYSTYPRTYDLLHAWNVFSDIYNHDCSAIDLLLEMDRLLRPQGVVIIRDRAALVEDVRKQLNALHWNVWSEVFDAEKDEISDGDEKILIARKQLWQPEDILWLWRLIRISCWATFLWRFQKEST